MSGVDSIAGTRDFSRVGQELSVLHRLTKEPKNRSRVAENSQRIRSIARSTVCLSLEREKERKRCSAVVVNHPVLIVAANHSRVGIISVRSSANNRNYLFPGEVIG